MEVAAEGAAVVVTASEKSRTALDTTVALIQDAGGRASALCCDLSDAAARSIRAGMNGLSKGRVERVAWIAAPAPARTEAAWSRASVPALLAGARFAEVAIGAA